MQSGVALLVIVVGMCWMCANCLERSMTAVQDMAMLLMCAEPIAPFAQVNLE